MNPKQLPRARVSMEDVRRAVEMARERDNDWQAQMCEIAMIPAVQSHWRAANRGMPELRIERHDGIEHKGFSRELNRARCDAGLWEEVSGYTLVFSQWSCWNSKRAEHYAHSASSTWDGARRDTYHGFIELLQYASLAEANERMSKTTILAELLNDWNVEIV